MSDILTPSRYIPHTNSPPIDLKPVKSHIQDALIENVHRVCRHPSSNPKVYHGSAGEIIMDMRDLSGLSSKDAPSPPTSTLIAVPFHEPEHGSRVAFLETSVGPATLVLVRQLRLRQNPDSKAHEHVKKGKLDAEILEELELQETWRGALELISSAQDIAVTEQLDEDGCEVLYGRAGLLYALIVLRSELTATLNYIDHAGKLKDKVVRGTEKLCSDKNIQDLVDDIVQRGELGARRYADELEDSERDKAPPLMWKWHGSRYLGAAHGVAGILHMLLHAPSEMIAPYWDKIISTVEWLLAIQDPFGNWPTKAGRHMPHIPGGAAVQQQSKRVGVDEEYDDALVQWCHGAPGFLFLFASLLRRSTVSPSACPLDPSLRSSIIAAMTRGGELVYARGLLRKGVGLCHGVAGSVYALLAVSSALDSFSSPSPSPSSSPAASGTSHVPSRSPSPPSHPPSPPRHSHSIHLPRKLSRSRSQRSPALDQECAYWLLRAVHLADLATAYRTLTQEGKMFVPDHPYCLYEGVAGMCCAWAEVLARITGKESNGSSGKRSGMPGFDDLAMLQ